MLHAGDYRIALDMREPDANLSFISHAHTDHIAWARGKVKTLASRETAMVLQARDGIRLNYVESVDGMEMLDAGHVIGSKQLRVEADGNVVTYSGDFQMQRSEVAAPIQVKQADIVILDSTYHYPGVVFDSREEVISAMHKYISDKLEKGIVLFGAYPFGKSQEIIKICNNIGVAPLVNRRICLINRVYQECGISLDYISMMDSESEYSKSMNGNFVAVVDSNKLDMVRDRLAIKLRKKVYTAVATGWAKTMRYNTDVQFALSDHADFEQATQYIDQCGAKAVYTKGYGAEAFAATLSAAGYNAAPYSKYLKTTAAMENQG